MDIGRPYLVFSTSLDLEVLLVLRGTTRPLTGREIARLVARGSPAGVQKALHRLVASGIVHTTEAGRAHLYVLNRDHLAAPAVETLASMRKVLEARLKEAIAEWDVLPTHVSVFGSAARGDGGTESDIDLLVVRPRDVGVEAPRWREQLDGLERDVQQWTGNHLAISEVDERELQALGRERPPVAEAIASEAVTLYGPPARELLRPAR